MNAAVVMPEEITVPGELVGGYDAPREVYVQPLDTSRVYEAITTEGRFEHSGFVKVAAPECLVIDQEARLMLTSEIIEAWKPEAVKYARMSADGTAVLYRRARHTD